VASQALILPVAPWTEIAIQSSNQRSDGYRARGIRNVERALLLEIRDWDVAPGVRNRSLQGVESHDQVIAGQ
jgi:hypothetical protein